MKHSRMEGKIALVTGGASGLGAAMTRMFVGEGARVLLTDIDFDGATAVATQLGDAAAAHRHDVTCADDWSAAIAAAEARFGGLHILVNNAGIAIAGTVEETSLEDWRRVHAVDLDGVFLGCKLALPLIAQTTAREGSRGSILNVSSIAGVIAAANMAAYNSAKAGVRHLTKSVALHCARAGYPVTCNSVHPTFIDTPIIGKMMPARDRDALIAKFARQVPLGRIGEPDDIAYAALYLCSDEAKFVTGAELYIDGGISAM
jgi:NAD(P)-dependent dehydrogenase (short-subunit alcohol dehydrogenase family)